MPKNIKYGNSSDGTRGPMKASNSRPQIATKRLGTSSTRKFGAAPAPANLPRPAESPAPPNRFIESANAVRVPKKKEELGGP